MKDLAPVIQWLENGCNVADAISELKLIQDKFTQPPCAMGEICPGCPPEQAAKCAALDAESSINETNHRLASNYQNLVLDLEDPDYRAKLAAEWGYVPAPLQRVEAERDQLRAEVEGLRKPLTPEAVWQLWAEVCKPERPTVDLVEAFARAIEAAKEAK